MMSKTIYGVLLTVIIGCSQLHEESEISLPIIVSDNQPAGGSYFTNDHLGNPVLCWTAGESGNEQLYYAIYNKEKEAFDKTVAVPSNGTNINSESMNKVAFKKDGTIVAVFARKHPTEQNRFAGSIFYTQSFDGGQSWQKKKFLHSDTLVNNSRSYFDISLLPDGELGVVWLDSRLSKGKEGSALFFAKTKGNEGFQKDYQIGETVCQCCRTDIYLDQKGKVHVLYRDIEQTIKGEVRDFNHTVSFDNGDSFINDNKISNDNWVIDGCPHTGGSMYGSQDRIEIVWFTAGGVSGLYHTATADDGSTFESRQLISENGRHPQIAIVEEQTVFAWQESMHQNNTQPHESHGKHTMQGSSSAIILAVKDHTNKLKKLIIDENGESPVLNAGTPGLVLVAYNNKQQILVKKVKI